MIGEVLKKFEI
jgi:hypothetical protein